MSKRDWWIYALIMFISGGYLVCTGQFVGLGKTAIVVGVYVTVAMALKLYWMLPGVEHEN